MRIVFRWLKQFVGRPDRRNDPEESVVDAVEERVSDEDNNDLFRQAELAEAVKAKAAFGAMLTDDTHDREQYERLRDDALEILLMINNEFYAGFARHQIIRLCIGAGERDRAAALLAEVEDEFILDEIREEFPDLEPASSPTR